MNTKKNILIIAYDGMNKSGVPGVIMEIINGLSKQYNFSIAVFEDIKTQYHYQRLLELGVEIINIPKIKSTNKIRNFYNEYIGYHNFLYKYFKKLFKEKHIDIVHSFKEGDSSGIFKAAKKYGIKNRIWHTTVLHRYKGDLIGFLSRHKQKLTNKYVSNCVGGSKLSCELAFKKKEFKVIVNCYNSDIYSFIQSGPFKRLELVQVGYLSPNKNQLFSLEVCKKLINYYPDMLMHFFGYTNDSIYGNKFNNFISDNHLEKNVIIHNPMDSQLDVLKSASFSLTPSIIEGFSLTLIEAQACGVNCIASTGVPEDANAGGVTYLDLNIDLWAQHIIDSFKSNKGVHTKFDMTRYQRQTFVKNIADIYKLF